MGFNFTTAHVDALRNLDKVVSPSQWVLIGGAAIASQMDLPRNTEDLDLVAAINLDDLRNLTPRLAQLNFSHLKEHRWVSSDGVGIDILPARVRTAPGNILKWPESGNTVNLAGLHLAFTYAVSHQVVENLTIRVAQLRVLFLLKMISYMDQPWTREKDLSDIASIITNWLPLDDGRRWGGDVMSIEMEYDLVPACVMGKELSEIVQTDEKELILKFISMTQDENDRYCTQPRLSKLGPPMWHGDPEKMIGHMHAFKQGLT